MWNKDPGLCFMISLGEQTGRLFWPWCQLRGLERTSESQCERQDTPTPTKCRIHSGDTGVSCQWLNSLTCLENKGYSVEESFVGVIVEEFIWRGWLYSLEFPLQLFVWRGKGVAFLWRVKGARFQRNRVECTELSPAFVRQKQLGQTFA